jgi:hypothetical protein
VPIKPENKHRYPKDWPQIRLAVLVRSHWRCEWCGVRDRAWGWRDHTGKFHEVRKRPLIEAHPRNMRLRPPFTLQSDAGPLKIIEVVITIAHLDHSPENCALENLKAGCQRCHLTYDKDHHAKNAYATRRNGKAISELFD